MGNYFHGFVTRLPKSKGYDCIFVVADMLTKIAQLFLVHKDATAKDIAHVSMKAIFLYHGLPCKIISNRD